MTEKEKLEALDILNDLQNGNINATQALAKLKSTEGYKSAIQPPDHKQYISDEGSDREFLTDEKINYVNKFLGELLEDHDKQINEEIRSRNDKVDALDGIELSDETVKYGIEMANSVLDKSDHIALLSEKSLAKEWDKEDDDRWNKFLVNDGWIKGFKIDFEEGIIAEDTNGFIGVIEGLKIVCTGKTKEECFEECIISLKVLLAYNSDINLPNKTINHE